MYIVHTHVRVDTIVSWVGAHGCLAMSVIVFASHRAEEETAARVKLEKENRELHSQLQETQDDLESEKDARQKVERQRRQLNEVSLRMYI